MSEMEEKLGAILGNPQMMQQIMSLAQSMGQSASPAAPPPPEAPSLPTLDPKVLSSLSGLLTQSRVDGNQQNLLKALGPYISPQRIGKLEKAMQAAKLARAASSFLSAGGLQLLQGRDNHV